MLFSPKVALTIRSFDLLLPHLTNNLYILAELLYRLIALNSRLDVLFKSSSFLFIQRYPKQEFSLANLPVIVGFGGINAVA